MTTVHQIRFQKLNPQASLPLQAHPGDAGMDLHACEHVTLAPGVEVVPPGVVRRLEQEIPAARLDDHQRYLGALISFARSLQLIAVAVVLLVGYMVTNSDDSPSTTVALPRPTPGA